MIGLGLFWSSLDLRPVEHFQFLLVSTLLAAHLVMEVTGPVTREREDGLLELMNLDRNNFEELVGKMSWDRQCPANTRMLWDSVGRSHEWKHLHCVRILSTAFLMALRQADDTVPPETQMALTGIARACSLEEQELRMVCAAVMEEATKQHEEEGE